MSKALTLMAVHAHPDDESSSTGGVPARYAQEGATTIVVTCTNGEPGDGPGHLKPQDEGHDPAEVARTRLAELRRTGSQWRRGADVDRSEALLRRPAPPRLGTVGRAAPRARARSPGPARPDPDPELVMLMAELEERITTEVDIADFVEDKRDALAAHAGQLNESWFGKLPEGLFGDIFGHETFIRAHDTTGSPTPETDLFAGLRAEFAATR